MKVYFDTIGCRLNQSEIERMAAQFRAAGYQIVESAGLADLVVVNTCAVTTEASSDSRQKIRQAYRAGAKDIIVTGCWATLEPESAASLPGVSRVFPNPEKDHLAGEVLNFPTELFELEPLERQPLPGLHQRTRAFIKAQDGCNNFCTFCITRIARGKGCSEPLQKVIHDIIFAEKGGTKEAVLSGVHLGSWGSDFSPKMHLEYLIRKILAETGIPRLRLSSLEPWDLPVGFFNLWEDPRLCRHLHLPLQSGSARILKMMARKTTPEAFASLVASARKVDSEFAITTDIIVGFPGETDDDFEESMVFVKKMEFAAGHVFTFSTRPGTPAEKYPGQIPQAVRKERSARMRTLLAESSERFQRRFLGRSVYVLWESASEVGPEVWRMEGLSDQYLRVTANWKTNCWNTIHQVQLIDLTEKGFKGVIEESPSR